MKFLLISALIVAVANACAPPPGVTWTTTTVTTMTTSGSGVSTAGGVGQVGNNERELIRSTWEMARKNGNVAPKVLFRFLKTHPEYQKMFSSFADVPVSQLMKNGNFLAQAYTIAAGLNVVIQSLGSQELLAQEIAHLGTAHYARGAKIHMFEQFGKSFVTVLEEELGSRFTVEAKEAMQNGFRGLVNGIAKTLRKPEEVPHPITALSPRMISNTRRVWETVRSERYEICSHIFKQMFAETSSLQKAFATFADVPIADLDSNADYRKQVNLVADRLDNMIATLDNTLQIMGQFKYMGHSHAPRGIDRRDFDTFVRLFIERLAAKGVSAGDLEPIRSVLGVSVDKIAENLH